MSRLNELSTDEIKFLEVVACCVRFIPRESRDAINHVLEIVRSENKDEDEPKSKFKVGDRVRFNHFGELKAGVVTDIFNNEYKVEARDDIYFVLEEALTLDTKPQPQLKVGDRVETEDGMGTAKIVSDDGDFVVSRLDDGTCAISKNVPLPEKEGKPTAEDSEENNPYVGAKPTTKEQALRELSEIGKKMRNPENRKQVDEEWRKELATKKNEKICGETIPAPAWQSYRMELAKAVAIAYAEKGRYEPWEIGAKAVEVANGVVEQLKNSKI